MRSLVKKLSSFVVFVAALSSCTVVVEEPRPIRPGPVACTREFAPVCGVRGGRERTFANACLARADGFSIVHRGECRPVRPPPAVRPPKRPAPVACTMEINPVCAVRGNRWRTFDNACLARASGFTPRHRGSCH